MIGNNTILIDGILDQLLADNHIEDTKYNRGKVFERFAIMEILKTYDMTKEQILDGIVDGGDDGGIDGMFFFVNGRLILISFH